MSAKHLPVYYLLLQDYVDATRYHGLSVAWTLSIEVTYYALLPGLAWLALATASRLRRRLLPELAIVACFALISVALHVVRPSAPDMILTYTDWFAAGMLLAVASLVLGPRALSRRLAICLWLAAVVLFAAETRLAYGNYGGHLLLIVAAAMIVLPAVFPARGGLVSAVLNFPALLWLGLISYGIYLWHVPMISGIEDLHGFGFVPLLMLTAVATVAVAAVSYYVLEAPLLRFKDRSTRAAGADMAVYHQSSS